VVREARRGSRKTMVKGVVLSTYSATGRARQKNERAWLDALD
jgi:hypothetical protein